MSGIGRSADPFRPILDVGAALVSSPLAGEALQNVAAAIGEAMNVSSVDIQSYVPERDCLVERAVWSREGLSDEDCASVGVEIQLAERPTFRPVVEERQVVECHVDDPDLPPEERTVFERWGYRTTLYAPLLIGDEVIGVLGVTETRFVRRFLSMEIELFEQLAGMAAAAMRNAELFRIERRLGRRLEQLLDISHGLSSSAHPDAVLDSAARALPESLGALRATVFSGDAEHDALTPRTSPGGDTTNGEEAERLAVPLDRHGQPLGLLEIAWAESGRTLDDDESAFVTAVADQLALALDNERLEAGQTG